MNTRALFEPIKVFVFDVDGVLTNGTLLVTEEGHLLRTMNIKDGYALQLAIKKGYQIWIISGGTSNAVVKRLSKLGLEEVHIAVKDKAQLLQTLLTKYDIAPSALLYMGDDMPDRAVMQLCGLKACPADAINEIKAVADYISPIKGGEGCVREVIEFVLKLNNHWE
ncbi:MAG: HAD-IIIA family hydrolase [Bacteroidota bacterium]|nr:HAD-IIIA family hydrolase [Bacteroidota bacterium]